MRIQPGHRHLAAGQAETGKFGQNQGQLFIYLLGRKSFRHDPQRNMDRGQHYFEPIRQKSHGYFRNARQMSQKLRVPWKRIAGFLEKFFAERCRDHGINASVPARVRAFNDIPCRRIAACSGSDACAHSLCRDIHDAAVRKLFGAPEIIRGNPVEMKGYPQVTGSRLQSFPAAE